MTGANKGIGLQICKTIVQTVPDAHVLLVRRHSDVSPLVCAYVLDRLASVPVPQGSRSKARGEKAVAEVIASEPTADGRVELVELDVTDEASVATAAKDVAARYEGEATPLYGICNNAGVGFGRSIKETLATNFYGAVCVTSNFLPLVDPACGRVCNIASASAPNYVRGLDAAGKQLFTSRETSWEQLESELQRMSGLTDYEGVSYGLSKAALNSWTMQVRLSLTHLTTPAMYTHAHARSRLCCLAQLAAANPVLKINSCSPGYILTDLTAGMGATKRPAESNCHVAPMHLLFGDIEHPEVNKGRCAPCLASPHSPRQPRSALSRTPLSNLDGAQTMAAMPCVPPSTFIVGQAIRRMWATEARGRCEGLAAHPIISFGVLRESQCKREKVEFS